jgi:hypothetical protein
MHYGWRITSRPTLPLLDAAGRGRLAHVAGAQVSHKPSLQVPLPADGLLRSAVHQEAKGEEHSWAVAAMVVRRST